MERSEKKMSVTNTNQTAGLKKINNKNLLQTSNKKNIKQFSNEQLSTFGSEGPFKKFKTLPRKMCIHTPRG